MVFSCAFLSFHSSVFRGRLTRVLFEHLVEIDGIRIAYLYGNFINSVIGLRQQLLCFPQAQIRQVFLNAHALLLRKNTAEVGG